MFLLSLTATCQVCALSLKAGLYTYKGLAADCLQPTLQRRSGFRQQLRPSVIAPREAWRLLQGQRPCRVRASHPAGSSLASLAESGAETRRTRGTPRRQRLLAAGGVTAPPAGLGQLRPGWWRTPRVCPPPQATRAPPAGRGGAGPPGSSGRGRSAERRRSTGEAPCAPAHREGGGVLAEGKPTACGGGAEHASDSEGGQAHAQGQDVTAVKSFFSCKMSQRMRHFSGGSGPWCRGP